MKILTGIILLLIVSSNVSYSQDDRERIGEDELLKSGPNYYNYSDKDKVNIEVSLWGYVKNPGKYLIPRGTTAIELITLGGGPTTEALLNDVRLVRMKNDSLNISSDQIIRMDYNDFLWEEQIRSGTKKNPVLLPGDMVLLPGEPRYFFRDNLGIILSISSFLLTATVLVINIVKD